MSWRLIYKQTRRNLRRAKKALRENRNPAIEPTLMLDYGLAKRENKIARKKYLLAIIKKILGL